MSNQFVYIKNIVANGFTFPKFEGERHERYVYTELTGRLIMLDADGQNFERNEDGILDSLLAQIQQSWTRFNVQAA